MAIIDYNKLQSLASVAETLALEPFPEKWQSFGWSVVETDGHDHQQLRDALVRSDNASGLPRCVIAHTTKGKGALFMANSVLWHYRTARGEELAAARAELEDAA